MELMRSVGRNVDRVTGANCGFFAPEGYFDLALEKNERFFEVVAVRTGSAARRDMHVDHAKSVIGVFSGDGDGIRVSDQTNVRKSFILINLSERQLSL